MAFAPPRKSIRPESARSPSCPALISRSSTTNSDVNPKFFTSTPHEQQPVRERGRPSMLKRYSSVKLTRPSISSTRLEDRRKSSSLDRTPRGKLNYADHDESSSSSSGNSTILSLHKPKLIPGAGADLATAITDVASSSRMSRKSVSGYLIQPKLCKEEIKIISEKQNELEMMKMKLQNARLKYLNTAVLHSIFQDSIKNKLDHQVTDTIKLINDVGLVETRKDAIIDTITTKNSKDEEKWLELLNVLEKLKGVKSLVGSRHFRQKLNNLDKRCKQLFDFIPIEGFDFGSDNQRNLEKIGEIIKMMDVSSLTTGGGPKVFVSLLKSGKISENEEIIKRDMKLLMDFKNKLLEKYSLKSSLISAKSK